MKSLLRSYTTEALIRGQIKRFMKRAPVLVMVCVAVAYCNDTVDGPLDPEFSSGRSPPPITISPDSVFFSTVPDTAQLRASVMDVVEDVRPAVVWTSSAEAVATVDSTGLVTSVGEGKARITAFFNGKSDDVPVIVDQIPTSVEISDDRLFFLGLHEYQEVRASVFDDAGSSMLADVVWTTDTGKIDVPVRCGGTPNLTYPCARSLEEGIGQLIVTYGEMADTIPVRVAIARRIRLLTPQSYTFSQPDTSFQIRVEVQDRARNVIEGAPVSFSSNDTTVVTVDDEGNVELVGYGFSTIQVRAGTISTHVIVDVLFPIASIRVDPSEAKLYAEGDSVYLSAIGISANHNERPLWGLDVAWATTDASIVTVDDYGLLIAGAEGHTSVTASYTEGDRVFRDTASVEVEYVHRISIQPSSLRLDEVGDSLLAVFAAYDSDGNNVPEVQPHWVIDDTLVATVDQLGWVRAVAYGNATLTAGVGTLSASATVTVVAPSTAPPAGDLP